MHDRHEKRREFGMRFARGRRGHDHDHDDGHPGRRMQGGGRGGLRRFFAHGDLRLVILHLIAEKPRHGYEIIKAIEDSVGGAYSPSPGVVYPTLTLLEELGYVTATADGAKKLHAITEEGRSFIAANRASLDALLARMGEAGTGRGRRSPAIMLAMENLKLALRLRMASGPLTDQQIDGIAATINEAATKVQKA